MRWLCSRAFSARLFSLTCAALLTADGGSTGGHPNVGNPGNPRVFMDISIGKRAIGRVVFEVAPTLAYTLCNP